MCFRHVPEQARKKLDDQSEVLVLIGYDLIGAYKMYSPIKDKLLISKDGLVDERKGWNWSRSSVQQEDEQSEASTSKNEQVDTSTVRIEEPHVQLCSKERTE